MNAAPDDPALDDRLMAGIVAGDTQAFTQLFRRRRDDVYRVALLISGDPAIAQDVAQDVFLAVIREAARYQPGRSSVSAWLCGIARNHARRHLQQGGRVVPLDDEPNDADVPTVRPDPVADLDMAQNVHDLRRAIRNLPIRYREVVVLCDLQELSYADAAAALDCAVGTVRSRLHRARARLTSTLRKRNTTPSSVTKGCVA